MNLKSKIPFIKIVFLILTFAFITDLSIGQQTPQYPVSYRIYSPFIFNPAIAGSKDFFSVDVMTGKYDKSNSQIISGSTRLIKSRPAYFSSSDSPEFTNIGIGGLIFNELNEGSRNIGIGATGSYHLQLDKNALSFLSFGVTFKAIYNDYSGNIDLSNSAQTAFFPNADAGVYYYNKNFYTGLSVTNILGSPSDRDSTDSYTIPGSRQFFFQLGYKMVISRSLNILIEPSLIVNANDSLSGKITDMLKPGLKLYAGNICVGTYFNDFNKISFFFQYKYPKFYIGTYFELPYNSPFYKNPNRVELAFGINLSAIRYGSARVNHW
jgi:type IX secretion system PorP/SprF family membrane protein